MLNVSTEGQIQALCALHFLAIPLRAAPSPAHSKGSKMLGGKMVGSMEPSGKNRFPQVILEDLTLRTSWTSSGQLRI